MKITKNKGATSKNYRELVIGGVFIFTAVTAVLLWIFFAKPNTQQPKSPIAEQPQSATSKDAAKTEDGSGSNSGNKQPLNTTNQVPAVQTPTNSASFPIENARYRIEKNEDGSFSATLYAVINRPEQYTEYIAQLKQYKQEVTTYLTERFGTAIKINWSPKDAESL